MRGRGLVFAVPAWVDAAVVPSITDEVRVTQFSLAVCVPEPDEPLVPVEPPDGDGTPVTGVNPDPGDSICGAEVPVTWCEIEFPDAITRRFAKVPINQGDQPKEARDVTFGTIRRSLSNAQGEPQGSTMTPTLSDTDGVLRAAEDADTLVGSRYTQYVSSQARLAFDPSLKTRVFDGIITDTEPVAPRLFTLTVTDYLTVLLDEFNKRLFPSRVFTLDDFPTMGNDPEDPVSPGNPTMLGTPVPRLYGQLSDEADPAPVGVVPWVFTGRVPFASRGGQLWDEYVCAGHALGAWQSHFVASGGGLSTGTSYPSRVQINAASGLVEVAWPGTTWWADEFGTAQTITRNGREYAAMYMFGPRSDLSRSGQVPHVSNVWGVADEFGLVITDLYLQFIDVLTNVVFGTYESGPSLEVPTVGTGAELYARIDTDTIFALKVLRDAQIPGGVPGAFILGHGGEGVTFGEILRLFATNGHFDYGTNRHGQLMVSAIDTGAPINRHLTALAHVLARTYKAKRQRDLVRNVLPYHAARRYVPPLAAGTPAEGALLPVSTVQQNPDWAIVVEGPDAPRDTVSVSKYGEREQVIDFELVRDPVAAAAVVALTLAETATAPVIASFVEAECGVDTDLGQVDALVHFDALSEAERSLRCEAHELNLDDFSVAKTYREITLE